MSISEPSGPAKLRKPRETTDVPIRRRAPVPKAECALARAAEEIGDRWMLLILREAFFGVMRYDDIRADLEIPRAMLSDRLSKLVARGCLEKRAYKEEGNRQRYGYALTEKGRGLATAFIALTQWSEAFILGGRGPVYAVDAETGKPLEAALVDEDGQVIAPENAAPALRDP